MRRPEAGWRIRPAGRYGLLLEFDDPAAVAWGYRAVQVVRERIGSIVDVVPAERTVLAIGTFDEAGRRGLQDLAAVLAAWDVLADGDPDSAASGPVADPSTVELPVRYDGPDLAEVSELTGLTPAEVVARHTETEFTVAFTGFAPGFAYLTGLPPELEVPRRAVPRTKVAAGAVGLAGRYSGVYPRESPGGWQIIGRLTADAERLWDVGRGNPALLQPGTRVRFRAAGGEGVGSWGTGGAVIGGGAESAAPPALDAPLDAAPGSAPSARPSAASASGFPPRAVERAAMLRILRPGPLTTVQDLGRPGLAHLGVPRSGAADRASLRLANRLVGNPENAAALETTLAGCTVGLTAGRWIAVTGARAPITVTVGGRTRGIGRGAAEYLPAGSVIDIGAAETGIRSYLAVAGGLYPDAVLGSHSTDVLSGLGPAPIRAGDLLPLGTPVALPPDIPVLGLAPQRDHAEPAVLRLLLGPRDDWFTPEARRALPTAAFTVTPDSNRTALRLTGPRLPRTDPARELASEPLVPGAVQIPPDGNPVLFLADHPVTGGYPVIGCVDPGDLDLAARVRPGQTIRFRLV